MCTVYLPFFFTTMRTVPFRRAARVLYRNFRIEFNHRTIISSLISVQRQRRFNLFHPQRDSAIARTNVT